MDTWTVIACSPCGRVLIVALGGTETHVLLRVLKGAAPPQGDTVRFCLEHLRDAGHGQLRHALGKPYVAYMGRGPRAVLIGLLALHPQRAVPLPAAHAGVAAHIR